VLVRGNRAAFDAPEPVDLLALAILVDLDVARSKIAQEGARLVANHEVHDDAFRGGRKLGRRPLGRCGGVPQVWALNLGDQERGACQ
jgi:hypothetical protein